MCKCGLNHRGWETNLCRIELAKNTHTNVPALLKQTLLSDPSGSKKPVTVTKQAKASVTVTNRMAELRKRKAATGITQAVVWAHVDDHAAIKKYATELADKRC